MTACFSGSYDPADVTFLLTPIDLPTTSIAEKEALMREGRHYSEILSAEVPPSPDYLAAYHSALAENAERLATDICALASALAERPSSPAGLVLVSFARAGTPIGVLINRALCRTGKQVTHYSISIVRDRGIDPAALAYVLARHAPSDVVFIDGWTGKGAISRELRGSIDLLRLGVNPYLVVVADPAGQADLAATGEDYLIPSGILNGIVSGLVSRSVIVPEFPPEVFHACRVLHELADQDLSREFVETIDRIARRLPFVPPAQWPEPKRAQRARSCARLVESLQARYRIADVNLIKPGLAETTRAVLRRNPRVVLMARESSEELVHLLLLCAENNVPVDRTSDLENYLAVAILA